MLLVDTCVISEARKGTRANPGVRAFWATADSDSIYLSAQSVGELRAGVDRIRARGDHPQADTLQAWLDEMLAVHADRILDFDRECAEIWGALMARGPQRPIDKQIAAIALIHDLDVVTRNAGDFRATGVRLLNPFR